MRKVSVGLILVLALAAGGCCTKPPSALVTVPVTGQHTSMWCWAASGQMTMNYHGASVTQCDEANKRFGRTDCCNTPTPAACVVGGWPEYPKYGFSSVHTSNAALSWNQIREEIYCRKRPFAFTWHWPSGGGHMMVISGYVSVLGMQFVRVNNPSPWDPVGGGAQYFTTYSDYVSGPGHTHWDDYYKIKKQ